MRQKKCSASVSRSLNVLDVSELDRCFPEDCACLTNSLVHNKRSAWWTSKGGTQGWFENPQSPLCCHVSSYMITINGLHVGSQQKAQNDINTSHKDKIPWGALLRLTDRQRDRVQIGALAHMVLRLTRTSLPP